MGDTWFERLFKFSELNFSEGEIAFQAGSWAWFLAVALVILVVGFVVVYVVAQRYTQDRTKAISLGLRIPALCLLFLPLFEPVLVMPDVVPDENFVAVLIDDSESMQITDGVLGQTRLDDVQHVLIDAEDGVVVPLSEHFQIRYYTFSDVATRIDSAQFAVGRGRSTNLTSALDRVMSDFKGVPLAGIVLLTDGGDNSTDVPLNKAEELRALDIPLHIVGVGQATFQQEREILDVQVSKGVEETTGAEIDVKVRSWVSETGPVAFRLKKGEEVVFQDTRLLKGGGKIDQLTFFYEPEQPSVSEYTLEIDPATQEQNLANNSLGLLVDTRRDTIRVLFYEGHLRQEFKFAKRALEDDQVIDFTSVTRTGTGKFLRQGIESPDELQGGFAQDKAELFDYKAVVFGDVEAPTFSLEQMRMMEEFVRVRGGGFVMLGGRNSFVEGDFIGTPLYDVLPVTLDPSRRVIIPEDFTDPQKEPIEQGFRFEPTLRGLESPILKLSVDPQANRLQWSSLPGVTSINYLGVVKPGAQVLAEKPEDAFGDREPLLIVQRYGRGRSAALATASTWRWQMLSDANDVRHERFWRQLIRWAVASAPNRVNIDMPQTRFTEYEEVPLVVNIFDADYQPYEAATVRGFLTTPFGGVEEVALQADLTQPGTFSATFLPPDEGVYQLDVEAEMNGVVWHAHTQSFLVRPSKQEYYDATLKASFLQSLAQANDGVYYDVTAVGAIPDNMRGRRTSTSVYRAEYLWDMPIVLGLVLLLLSAEWMYRRRKGLP